MRDLSTLLSRISLLAALSLWALAGNAPAARAAEAANAAASAGTSTAGVTIVRLWPAYRTAEAGERLVEFFGRPEPISDRIIRRSRPEQRGGYYFTVRLAPPGLPAGAVRWRLRYLAPGAPEVRTQDFDVTGQTGRALFELGLTGDDWLDPKAAPLAWHLALLGEKDAVLVSRQSFLWSER